MRVLMVAAENDALAHGKVGGVADVIRDVPLALAELGHAVDVITPCYGLFAIQPGAEKLAELEVGFGGSSHPIALYRVPAARKRHDAVSNLVVQSPLFQQPNPGVIYSRDGDRPFATDATRFALLGRAVLELLLLGHLALPDALHLHDWHSAMVLVLRAYDPRYAQLRSLRTVFSVHNLALQGIRPLAGDSSSLAAWFPDLTPPIDDIVDPRYDDCINPMRAAIRLADRVHTVSPTYALEILKPSAHDAGFYGGEGLEGDLREAHEAGRLVGILNGTDYDTELPKRPSRNALWRQVLTQITAWMGKQPQLRSADFIAWQRAQAWLNDAPDREPMLMTSIGRLTDQKVRLLVQRYDADKTVLDALMEMLGRQARLLVIGSGDPDLEAAFLDAAARHDNLLFMNGYAAGVADTVYVAGDLFLMPSSFEPCGISQMLAMRAGQPCLVHGVGGLKDTVEDDVTGFVFGGATPAEQAEAMLARVKTLLRSHGRSPRKWQSVRKRAAAKRFLWRDAAQSYVERLYAP